MFPAQFDYRRATTTPEAIEALTQYDSDARILAGGQSLIPAMRFRLARPAVLIDINPVRELDYIREEGGMLRVGAAARDFAVETSALVINGYQLIADASAVVADPVVRQMGTLVGSLCHNDPAGDWSVVALAARAEVMVQGAKGNRVVPIDDFIVDSFATAVADGEMALEVCFPTPGERSAGAYAKMERKVGDFATACAGTQLTLAADGTIASAGVAIGAVAATALRVVEAERMLVGAKPTRELVRAAANEARKIADPSADTRGSVEFKKDMAGVLTARALEKALSRLGAGGF